MTNNNLKVLFFDIETAPNTKECTWCKKTYHNKRLKYTKAKNNFCSKDCSLEFSKSKKKYKSCEVCCTSFRYYPYQVKRGDAVKYCSTACAARVRSLPENTSTQKKCYSCGEVKSLELFYNNKSKKQGVTDECKKCLMQIQYTKTTLARIKLIDERGKRCEKCKLSHKNYSFFEVDHIIRVADSKDKRRPIFYTDKGNLQVLCPNCHKEKTIKENGYAR